MPSEFQIDFCFIREGGEQAAFLEEIRREMGKLFDSGAKWFADAKKQDPLDIAVVEASGLSALSTEDEVLQHLESRMNSECWEWLSGYRLTVTPKEDAGSCRLPGKGAVRHGLGT